MTNLARRLSGRVVPFSKECKNGLRIVSFQERWAHFACHVRTTILVILRFITECISVEEGGCVGWAVAGVGGRRRQSSRWRFLWRGWVVNMNDDRFSFTYPTNTHTTYVWAQWSSTWPAQQIGTYCTTRCLGTVVQLHRMCPTLRHRFVRSYALRVLVGHATTHHLGASICFFYIYILSSLYYYLVY